MNLDMHWEDAIDEDYRYTRGHNQLNLAMYFQVIVKLTYKNTLNSWLNACRDECRGY